MGGLINLPKWDRAFVARPVSDCSLVLWAAYLVKVLWPQLRLVFGTGMAACKYLCGLWCPEQGSVHSWGWMAWGVLRKLWGAFYLVMEVISGLRGLASPNRRSRLNWIARGIQSFPKCLGVS